MNLDERPNIIEVFEHYGSRVMAGHGWRKATCPLLSHEDQSPSASVNEALGKWTCWSCDARGDVYDVISTNESLNLSESVAWGKKNFEGVDRIESKRKARGVARPRGGNWAPPWRGI